MNEFNRPAIVNYADECEAIVKKLRQDLRNELMAAKLTVQHRINVGEGLTKLKAILPRGEWAKRVLDLGLSRATAYRRLQDFENREQLIQLVELGDESGALNATERPAPGETDDDPDFPPEPGDPTAERGDAFEGDDKPTQDAARQKVIPPKKLIQPSLALNPKLTIQEMSEIARRKAANALTSLRLRVEEARDLADELCHSPLGDEFQKQARFSSLRLERTPPTERVRATFRLPALDELLRILDRTQAEAGLPPTRTG